MKRFSLLAAICLVNTSCTPFISNLWEGAKTSMRQVAYSSKAFVQQNPDSRLVSNTSEFFGSLEGDFVPLSDQDVQAQTAMQAHEVPGLPGGRVPGIESFHAPSKALAATFSKIYFNTDQYTPKDKDQLAAIRKMGAFLKKHPSVYVFIEGHTDQRASEAYNLSLGTRRSNCIRNMLIKEGASADQLFTISYGKERPEVSGHTEKSWSKNRRVAFKIYDKEGKL